MKEKKQKQNRSRPVLRSMSTDRHTSRYHNTEDKTKTKRKRKNANLFGLFWLHCWLYPFSLMSIINRWIALNHRFNINT